MVEVKKQTTKVLVASAPCPAKIPMKTSTNINSIHIKEKIPLDRFLFLTIIQDAYNKIGGPWAYEDYFCHFHKITHNISYYVACSFLSQNRLFDHFTQILQSFNKINIILI
jgi:hypothetical protein